MLLQFLALEQRPRDTNYDGRAEFLHEVEGQRRPVFGVEVEEPKARFEADAATAPRLLPREARTRS